MYLNEKDDKYLSWFLNYFKPQLNPKIMALVQNYAMQGHFFDMKSVCITGLMKAQGNYDVSCELISLKRKPEQLQKR